MPSKMLKSSRKQKILSISDERVTKNNSTKRSIPTHSTTMDKVRFAFRVIQSFNTNSTSQLQVSSILQTLLSRHYGTGHLAASRKKAKKQRKSWSERCLPFLKFSRLVSAVKHRKFINPSFEANSCISPGIALSVL